jgi:hypothetical protein
MSKVPVAGDPRSRSNQYEAESTRIPISKSPAPSQAEAQMLVSLWRRCRMADGQSPAHPEMNKQHVWAFQVDHEVLCPSADIHDLSADTAAPKRVGIDTFSQANAVDPDVLDSAANDDRSKTPFQNLDLR